MATSRHEIPTHLNVEDRAFIGLSMRQLLMLLVGLAGGYVLWERCPGLPPGVRLALAAVPPLIAALVALVRPAGRGLEEWCFVALQYGASPRVAVWRPHVRAADWRARDDGARAMTLHVHWAPDAAAPGADRPGAGR